MYYVISTTLPIMSGEFNQRIARTALASAEHTAGNVEAHASVPVRAHMCVARSDSERSFNCDLH